MRSRAILWAAAALLGIVATAAIAWTASQLAGQRIGLSSEPLSVASGLAPATPPARRPPKPARKPVVTATPSSPHPTPAPQAAAPLSTGAVPAAPAPPPTAAQSAPPATSVTPKPPASQQRDDGSGGSGSQGSRSGSGSGGGGQRDD